LKESQAPKSKAERRAAEAAEAREQEADALKDKANAAFRNGEYVDAQELYSAALQLANAEQRKVRAAAELVSTHSL
jgi:Flp pilus assembly protein TadD